MQEMTLIDKYIIARWCYAIGEDFISDFEYKTLHEKMLEQYPDNEYVNRSWSDDPCPLELLEKYGMQEYYRNLKFEYKSESIRSINSLEEYKAAFRFLMTPSRISYKLDGFNIQVNYYNGEPISAETRGRTGNSLNANVVMRLVPKKITLLGKVKVTGECVIPNKKWIIYKAMTGNTSQRSSVATALANEDTDFIEFVAFNIQSDTDVIDDDKYAVLKSQGFKTPLYKMVNNFDQLESAMQVMGKQDKVYPYPTDGIVLENDKQQVALRVYHWQEERAMSYVTGYEEKAGLYSIYMNVNIKPVKIGDSRRMQVAVTNLQYILDHNLQIGNPIAFDIRSMSTAALNGTATDDLQNEYRGRFDEFRAMIDERSKQCEEV